MPAGQFEKTTTPNLLLNTVNNLLSTSPDFRAELEALVSRHSDQLLEKAEDMPIARDVGVPEIVFYTPTFHTWYGKFSLVGGASDWYGTRPVILNDVAYKGVFEIPFVYPDLELESVDNLPQMAVGLYNNANTSVTTSTIYREGTIDVMVNKSPLDKVSKRPASTMESISCDSRTLQQINQGHSWLDPLRRQNLFVPKEYLGRLEPEALGTLNSVFDIHPVDFSLSMDPDVVDKNLKDAMTDISDDVSTVPGIVVRKEFWKNQAHVIASIIDSIASKDPTSSTVAFIKFSDTPHEQFELALDLIEAVTIIRNEFLSSWSASHIIPKGTNINPVLSVISSDVCSREHLLKTKGISIVDETTQSPRSAAIVEYLDGKLSLGEVRSLFC